MEYKLLSHSSATKLSEEINKYLQAGWTLHGDTKSQRCESWGHFTKLGEYIEYSQAVIKQ